ncbi:AI-2E family transporter [Desulfoplanes sp. PS50]|jgi:putative permease
MNIIHQWFRKYFSDQQVVVLALVLIFAVVVILTIGDMIAPVIASMVIAFLLESVIKPLERMRVPRLLAVSLVFIFFMLFLVFLVIGLLPLLTQQLTQFIQEVPSWLSRGQTELMRLPDRYPQLFTEDQVREVVGVIKTQITFYGQQMLSFSLSSMRSILTVVVYIVLMPIMVFFFLKDKDKITGWFRSFLPEDHSLASIVWKDVQLQTGNYVRGKIWEIIIIWGASYISFLFLGLNYAMLLSFLVGLSVIIPYIGATVVTVPVLLLAYFQWGWGSEFVSTAVVYGVIQLLDGNLLVPLLLSEVVNLHPVAIITAILVFGGFWGFWGVFFAIPLATLIQAVVINACPKARAGT